MRFRCLACGHEFEDRAGQTRNKRQCGKCGRRRIVESASFAAAVEKVRTMRASDFNPAVTREALAQILEAVNPVSPNASLASVLRGEFHEALNDPFVAAKAIIDVLREANREPT